MNDKEKILLEITIRMYESAVKRNRADVEKWKKEATKIFGELYPEKTIIQPGSIKNHFNQAHNACTNSFWDDRIENPPENLSKEQLNAFIAKHKKFKDRQKRMKTEQLKIAKESIQKLKEQMKDNIEQKNKEFLIETIRIYDLMLKKDKKKVINDSKQLLIKIKEIYRLENYQKDTIPHQLISAINHIGNYFIEFEKADIELEKRNEKKCKDNAKKSILWLKNKLK